MQKRRSCKIASLALAMTLALSAGGFVVYACPPEDVGGYILSVQNIKQNPELPNGCEITSLAITLQYMGFDVSKTELADEWLEKEYHGTAGPDPYEKYIGNPRNSSGWYCWAPPLVKAANAYLESQRADLVALDISGANEQLLRDYIDCGMPVMLWVTIDLRSPRRSASHGWYLPDGSWLTPYTNVHCLVLKGYDDGIFYVANPLNDTEVVDAELLLGVYEELGGHAMVITKDFTARNLPGKSG